MITRKSRNEEIAMVIPLPIIHLHILPSTFRRLLEVLRQPKPNPPKSAHTPNPYAPLHLKEKGWGEEKSLTIAPAYKNYPPSRHQSEYPSAPGISATIP